MTTSISEDYAVPLTALRGILMIVAGAVVFFYPTQAVRFVVLAGGGLLLVDGALGFMTLRKGTPDSTSYLLGLARNALSALAGLVVLFSPVLVGLFTLSFLAILVGLLALLVGLAEFGAGFTDTKRHSRLLSTTVGGAIYVVFGLALMFLPLSAASTLVRIASVALLAYGALLLYRVWQAYSRSA